MPKLAIATATTCLIALALTVSILAIGSDMVSDFTYAILDSGRPAMMTLAAVLVLTGLIARHPVQRRLPTR